MEMLAAMATALVLSHGDDLGVVGELVRCRC